MSRRTRAAAVAAPLLVVVSVPQAAWAHGALTPDRVARSATATLDLFLPSEREGATTTRVVMAVPAGFAARDCEEPVGWTCAVASDAVQWQDVAGIRDETHFVFTVTASSVAGTYTLPVEQSYDDGSRSVFAGRPGTPDEAPVLTVTGGATPAPNLTRRPTMSPQPTQAPRPTDTRTDSSGTPQAAVPTVVGSSQSAQQSGSTVTSEPPVRSAAAPSVFARPTSLPRGQLVSGGEPGDGGSLGVTLLAGGLVVLVGTAVVARRRTKS